MSEGASRWRPFNGHEDAVEAMGQEQVLEAMGQEQAIGKSYLVEAMGYEHVVCMGQLLSSSSMSTKVNFVY